MAKGIKTGGRVKGTLNKKTEALFDKCDRLGVDVFEELLKLCTHPEPSIQLGALKECASYLFPKRKALEVSGDADNPLAIINTSLAIVRAELQAEENERKQSKS